MAFGTRTSEPNSNPLGFRSMPPRSAAGLLQDVLDAAEFMRVRAIDLDAETFLRNEDLKVIFERKFEVVG